jgi:ATP phosphoribosyltransferase
MNGDRLIFAIPSKGRLNEPCLAFMADAGMAVIQSGGGRDYAGRLEGIGDVEVVFLSAAEIAQSLIEGRVHFGVTGEDLLAETLGERSTHAVLIKALGFGRADVVVAAPRAWIDVDTMADLDDVCLAFHARHQRRMRVATKYLHLTRAFFARAGIGDYRIVESLGATEGAPASGAAELIADITTTGATLAANQLKVLSDGVILRSQAQLAASPKAPWSAKAKLAARQVLDRVSARADARNALIVRVRMDRGVDAALSRLEREFGCRIAARPPANATHAEAVILTPNEQLYSVLSALRAAGAQAAVTAQKAEYVFTAENPLYAALEHAIGAPGTA